MRGGHLHGGVKVFPISNDPPTSLNHQREHPTVMGFKGSPLYKGSAYPMLTSAGTISQAVCHKHRMHPPLMTPLLLTRHPIIIAIHLGSRTIFQKPCRFLA